MGHPLALYLDAADPTASCSSKIRKQWLCQLLGRARDVGRLGSSLQRSRTPFARLLRVDSMVRSGEVWPAVVSRVPADHTFRELKHQSPLR